MIYRRIKSGESVEGIEIEFAEKRSNCIGNGYSHNDDSVRVQFVNEEADAIVYEVELPHYLRVKPHDLRRFAYDHEKVERLVAQCVSDNACQFTFLAIDDNSPDRLEHELFIALQDLSSVMDLISVECQQEAQDADDRGTITVEFEHKNGERRVLSISDSINSPFAGRKSDTGNPILQEGALNRHL